jgi:superfamily II DNA or RNA helicase
MKNNYNMYVTPRSSLPAVQCRFEGSLRPEQELIQKEAIGLLNRQRSILISLYPGGGKTITSLSIASKIGCKTLILVNKIVLIEQWKNSIVGFFSNNTGVQVLDTAVAMDLNADFYIMNAINVPKRPDIFQDIGTVIVDECHLMITKVFVQSLLYLFPRYLIGLSATPYRPDGLDVLLDLYFGTARIHRPLYRKHTVYTVDTGIEIMGERNERGQLDWNSILQAQMTNTRRNNFIRRLCLFFGQRNILILCKRVSQIQLLADLLRPDATVTTLKGNETTYDADARILIASIQKVGTGFSHDRLDMLILACDMEEYFLQYLGRVFRRPDVTPIIIDLIDKNHVLKRHARTRRRVYQESGGSIYDFHSMFSDVKMD